MSNDMKLIMERFNKAMTSETLTEQKSPLINALLGGEEEEEKPSTPQDVAPSKNTGISDFLIKRMNAYKAEGYKEVKGLGAAGIKPGTEIYHEKSSYGGYEVHMKFKGYPGKFIAFTEHGIRGVVKLHGLWTTDANEVNNWAAKLGGTHIGLGFDKPGSEADDDLVSATLARTPLLYKK